MNFDEYKRRIQSSAPADVQWFIETFFKVRHKITGQIIPAVMRRGPSHFLHHRTARDIIGKARTQYMSSSIEAINTKFALTNMNLKIAIVAQPSATEDWPKRHLDQMRFYYNSMPDAIQCADMTSPFPVKPELEEDSAYHMKFADIGSEIISSTAGGKGIGRGQPIDIVHGCLAADTLVLTAEGNMKRIVDIEPGDCVYTAKSGGIQPVTAKVYSGIQSLIKLDIWGNPATPMVVTPNHPVIGNSYGWKRADESKWVGFPIRNITGEMKSVTVDYGRYKTSRNFELTNELGWAMGLWLAEGSFCKNSPRYPESERVIYSLNTLETGFLSRLEELFPRVKNKIETTHGVIEGREVNGNVMLVRIGSAPFAKVLRLFFGKDKHIPDWIWNCPWEFLEGLVDGYNDGDGTKDWNITSVRPWILYQIRALLLSLERGYSSIFKLSTGNVWKMKLMHNRHEGTNYKGNSWRKHWKIGNIGRQPYVFVRIRSKTEVPQADTWDLEVRHGHSFSSPAGMMHNTEVPFWPQETAEQVVADFEALPIKWIVWEGTGGGEGGAFYEIFTKAFRGESEYTAHFYGWFWDKENCSIPEGSGLALPEDRGIIIPTEEETELILKWDLTIDNIRWRRLQYSKPLAQQEQAEDPVTMFLTSGQPVFDLRWTDRMLPRCRKPRITEDSGCLRIWKPPVSEGKYIVWSDPSGGDPTGHPSGTVVCRINPFEHVATLRGHWNSQVHKLKADELAIRFNGAFRGWERNNHGAAWEINEGGYNCYRHDDKKLGFPVNSKTKPMLRDYMAELLSVDGVETYDSTFVDEIRSWRHFDDKMEPAINKTDDILMPFMEVNYARIKGIAVDASILPGTKVPQSIGR